MASRTGRSSGSKASKSCWSVVPSRALTNCRTVQGFAQFDSREAYCEVRDPLPAPRCGGDLDPDPARFWQPVNEWEQQQAFVCCRDLPVLAGPYNQIHIRRTSRKVFVNVAFP